MITKELYDQAQTFDEFYQYIQDLYADGKTTGDNQSQANLDLTKLGIQRIKRGLKTTKVDDQHLGVIESTKAVNWLIITEAWCGDGSNSVPAMIKMAEINPEITVKVIIRDEHPEIIDNYLTNGGRAIPILVLLDGDLNEITHWGPRPIPAQQMVIENKANPVLPADEFKIQLQKWYIQDKNQTAIQEIVALLN